MEVDGTTQHICKWLFWHQQIDTYFYPLDSNMLSDHIGTILYDVWVNEGRNKNNFAKYTNNIGGNAYFGYGGKWIMCSSLKLTEKIYLCLYKLNYGKHRVGGFIIKIKEKHMNIKYAVS